MSVFQADSVSVDNFVKSMTSCLTLFDFAQNIRFFFNKRSSLLSFGGLQRYVGSYANHLFLWYECFCCLMKVYPSHRLKRVIERGLGTLHALIVGTFNCSANNTRLKNIRLTRSLWVILTMSMVSMKLQLSPSINTLKDYTLLVWSQIMKHNMMRLKQ